MKFRHNSISSACHCLGIPLRSVPDDRLRLQLRRRIYRLHGTSKWLLYQFIVIHDDQLN